MGIFTQKGPDPEVKKGIEELKKEIRNQKRTQIIYLMIGITASGFLGYFVGKFF